MAGVPAGEQHAPRRRADRAAAVMLGELHAFAGELVQRWRANDLLAEWADIAISQIIRQDEDDIRFSRRLSAESRGRDSHEQNQNHGPVQIFHKGELHSALTVHPISESLD